MSYLRIICLFSIIFANTSVFGSDKNPKVVVVGAGLGGLTTAYRLLNEEMDVEIYEARSRVGGRILTVNVNDNIAELGGKNIADGGEAFNIKRLIEEFCLELTFHKLKLDYSYFDGKDLIPAAPLLKNQHFDPTLLRSRLEELSLQYDNMKEILDEIINENDPLNKVIATGLASYEGAPIEQLSSNYIDTLYHLLLGGICTVHPGNNEAGENSTNLISVKGGNAQLPQKMAAALDNRIHLNMTLSKVGRNKDGSFKLTFNEGKEIECDILVLGIPCSIYENIIFEDNVIPSEKLENMKKIKYGTNAKMMIPISNTPSENLKLLSDKIFYVYAPYKLVNIFFTGESSIFSEETIRNTYQQVLPTIEIGMGYTCPSQIPTVAKDQHFATYHGPIGYSWPNDPYVKGSYSFISPGQEVLLTEMTEANGERFKTLFAPIQNLYFVGEHTTVLLDILGTMEAACESGERIARVILATCGREVLESSKVEK